MLGRIRLCIADTKLAASISVVAKRTRAGQDAIMHTHLASSALLLLATLTGACNATSTSGVKAPPAPVSVANTAQADKGWVTLFDGGDPAKNFRGFKKDQFPQGWVVKDHCLVHTGPGGGDIITRDSYGSFELELEWKLTPGGNSGIMYHVSEDMNNTYETGPEMQILDDSVHVDGKDRLTSAGADYALYAAPLGAVKPIGQWNKVRILVDGMHVQYFLNGVKTCDFIRNSADWKARVAASKFSKMPRYGTNDRGHIAFQDHGDEVWFQNIRVKALDEVANF